jgi:type VI secretion system secreted protein VgrG
MSQLSQANRSISITDFALGEDTLLLTAFAGSEYISDLFEFKIDVLSENLEITPEAIIGKTATVTVKGASGDRYFNGYICSFTFGEIVANNLRQYTLVMVPWLWFLSKTNDHRIFQEKNTKDIVSQVFQDMGFNDFVFKAAGGSQREYCVQHNESALNFVSRLLEEDGIAYYFKHEQGKHTLYLVDQKNAYEACRETDLEYSKGNQPNTQITHWEHRYEFKKGQWTLNDYHFKEPLKDLKTNTKTLSKFAINDKFEHYEYPGLYDTKRGDELVRIRLESEEARRDIVNATSNCNSFYAGGQFTLAKHATSSEKGSYIIAGITHSVSDGSYISGQEGQSAYTNNFVCIPTDVHFRPALKHQKPVMRGPQSAVVVGPDGEEVYIDEHGRVKVQFIWDRDGKHNENSSCYLRVVQSWAGSQWGASFIPRIGHEVIVDFLDGDPDRPLVTGSVYNGRNRPTYSSKTQSGIKTRSTKGGGAQNYNELRFEDKKDAEQIYIHAERNMDTMVENDETLTVDHDRTKHVKNDETNTIDKNRSITVGENHTETIAANMTITVDKNLTETIKVDYQEDVKANKNSQIGKDLTETIDANHYETVKKDYSLKAKRVQIVAQDEISLKTGSASILMKKNGDITIKGKTINVKGSSDVIIKGSNIKGN